ncbi:MAG: hypothetical protein ACTHJ5_02515 [Ilyomonas sp.]
MKLISKLNSVYKSLLAICILMLSQIAIFAQEDGGTKTVVTKTTHSESTTWYMQPWAWVVGGIILILILIALLSGRGNRVVVTKTTTTDTDVV